MIKHQTDLMKVGFDVVGIVNEALLSDQLITFRPDLVLTAGRGGRVSAAHVAQKLKENTRYQGLVVVMLLPQHRLSLDELAKVRMDALLELPVAFGKLLQVLAKQMHLDSVQLIDKYCKARLAEGADPKEIQNIKSLTNDRAARFERAMAGVKIDATATSFEKSQVKARQLELKKDWDFKRLAEIDILKQQFVKALFKKPGQK